MIWYSTGPTEERRACRLRAIAVNFYPAGSRDTYLVNMGREGIEGYVLGLG